VFYTSLGTNPEIYRTPQILQHYLDGIQFALVTCARMPPRVQTPNRSRTLRRLRALITTAPSRVTGAARAKRASPVTSHLTNPACLRQRGVGVPLAVELHARCSR